MVSLSTKWRGSGEENRSPENTETVEAATAAAAGSVDGARDTSPTDAADVGEPVGGATLSELVRAHAEVLEAEERARHPQAGPLAQPRLAAARTAEQELLAELGFLTFAEATRADFRAPGRPLLGRDTEDDQVETGEPLLPASSEIDGDLDAAVDAAAPTDHPGDRVEDTTPVAPATTQLSASSALSGNVTDGRADEKGNDRMDTSPTDTDAPPFWDQDAPMGTSATDTAAPPMRNQDDPSSAQDELLARLRASANEYVEAEADRARASATEIIQAARAEAQTTTDLARKLEETAVASATATAGELVGLLAMIDDLKTKLAVTEDEVRSRIDLFRMATGTLHKAGD